jgi:hypothetical protein
VSLEVIDLIHRNELGESLLGRTTDTLRTVETRIRTAASTVANSWSATACDTLIH